MIKRLALPLSVILVLGFLLSGCFSTSSDKKDKKKVRLDDTEWVSNPDLSCLSFEDDGEFRFYRDDDVRDDNYFEGEYDFYIGEDAIEYVTDDLEEYGLTKKEIDRFTEEEETRENFVCLVLHNESIIVDGEEVIDEPYDMPYYGFLEEDDDERTLTLVNMETATITEYDEKD